MSSETKLALNLPPSQAPRPRTSAISGMLTPSEIESLRREMNALDDLAEEAFKHRRPENRRQAAE